uniref:Uncharacterized protein n=1 Tax=viral metagenome TaxID=1070528 RepID=A0A6C0AXC7_9ZZZZ
MGSAIGTIQNKKIYITYDDSSNDVKIQGFLISIRKLSNNVIINDSNKLNECDIFIHLISNASIKNHNQLKIIDEHMDKISIFIYTDRQIPINNNTILSSNNKSIMLSYLDYESFDDITPIIVSKLVDVV